MSCCSVMPCHVMLHLDVDELFLDIHIAVIIAHQHAFVRVHQRLHHTHGHTCHLMPSHVHVHGDRPISVICTSALTTACHHHTHHMPHAACASHTWHVYTICIPSHHTHREHRMRADHRVRRERRERESAQREVSEQHMTLAMYGVWRTGVWRNDMHTHAKQ